MKRLLCLLCAFSALSFAAINSATVWDVRASTGAATNGGGYASGGTDMSQFDNKNAAGCTSCQSATVNISTTDAVTNNTTTVTSATANFSSALIGNTVYLTGTGTTTGWYSVTAVTDSQTITVDRATGSTGGTGVTINIGGALGTSNAGLAAVATAYVAGNTVYVQAGTYTITTAVALTVAGTAALPVLIEGYSSTHGDLGTPPLVTSSTTSVNLFTLNATSFTTFRNLKLTHTAATRGKGFAGLTTAGSYYRFSQIICDGVLSCFDWTSVGPAPWSVSDSVIVNTTSANGAIRELTNSPSWFIGLFCYQNTGTCINGGTSAIRYIEDSVIAKNGGTGGIIDTTSSGSTGALTVINSVIANNTADGIHSAATASAQFKLILRNNIIYGNGGFGVSFASATDYAGAPLGNRHNAWGSNSSGNTNGGLATGSLPVTLTADPFVAASTGNFALNATTGGGALLVSVGGQTWPTSVGSVTLPSPTSHLDIGAVQSAGGGQKAFTFIQ